MITNSNNCIPQKLRKDEVPDYICEPNGNKKYLSREDKKDYLYGGKCPKICSIKDRKFCPDVSKIFTANDAKAVCDTNSQCQFISNAVINRNGPNYCFPKKTQGCITLTEADLAKSDKELTDNPNVCNRLDVGCIFDRGIGDNLTSRRGEPKCLRGCLGSKYWKNPKYIWGGGKNFRGSYFNSDLKVGPIYLEAAPTKNNPDGWGGEGKLPPSLGIPYTESRGKLEPPCNLNEGNMGAFNAQTTGELLAGPGCRLTPPQQRFGMQDWSYTCSCQYLDSGGEFRSDAWRPCGSITDNIKKRDVCRGCYIANKGDLKGHCVLGEETPDTESKILGCLTGDCRVNRVIKPTECPSFCSDDISDSTKWRKSTQCSRLFDQGFWKLNPNHKNIISRRDRDSGKQAPPFIRTSKGPLPKPDNTDDLCNNCAQTPVRSVGSGTKHPHRSYCVVGGSENSFAIDDVSYADNLARRLSCPATCKQCSTGFFGEPLIPSYNLEESVDPSSAFNKGIIFSPWVGTQAVKEIRKNN